MSDLTVELIGRQFVGRVANNSTIAIPKEVTIWAVPKRGPDFYAPGVPQDVYTLRLLADRRGKLHNIMVLREISDETVEDWMNGVIETLS